MDIDTNTPFSSRKERLSMNNLHNRPQWLLGINLTAIILSVVMLTSLYLSQGLSAVWVLLSIITASLFLSIFSLFKQKDRQIIQVIKALANGDNTLGFRRDHPLRSYFDDVQQQMQSARFNAEQQGEFFKTLLVHVNLAVMVCDDQGIIIESNPAVARLLGKSVRHINDLNNIGLIISTVSKHLQNTVHWKNGEQQDTLTLQVSIAEIQGKERKIITLQSIHDQLLNKEQQAYKRLTCVLTHEVANTITPLASLAQTCLGFIPESLCFTDAENKQDLHLALTTLTSRAEYLGDFIARFRQISSLPLPQLEPTQISSLVTRISVLHQQQLSTNNISLDISVTNDQLVMLDSGQIEQVLINLVINAMESLLQEAAIGGAENKSPPAKSNITLTVGKNAAQQLYIEIADNGVGVAEHVIDMAFVPFFTTKPQGSGIGLSLSRQIMINHGGDLVYINRDKGACFRCVFG